MTKESTMWRFFTAVTAAAWLAPPSMAQTSSLADLALLVQVGRIPCELGAVVELQPDPKAESQFVLKLGKDTYQMRPVPTSTGVVRLEDAKLGAVWLQISNKSMLMSQKLGRRLADECMSPAQAAVALALKANPVPGLLDAPVTAATPGATPMAPAAIAPTPGTTQMPATPAAISSTLGTTQTQAPVPQAGASAAIDAPAN
jgi:hypothetical protein